MKPVCVLVCIGFVVNFSFGATRTEEEEKELLEEAGKMVFQLFTRKNPKDPWNFELNDLQYLQFSHFNNTRPLKILIHGWLGYESNTYNNLTRNALLHQDDVNVIVVSWDLESVQSYFSARSYVPTAGKVVAYLIDRLCSDAGVLLKDIHVIGHSLGAHVAGISGLYTTVGKIPRVSGLDPAGPLFFEKDVMRISQDSAEFVDIIHTAKWVEGIHLQVGHVDFYPNGGTPIQPGCGWDFLGFHSHRRAYWLYASSIINPGQFLSVACDGWHSFKSGECSGNNITEMGYHVDSRARGKYYLRTSAQMPYALEKSGFFP